LVQVVGHVSGYFAGHVQVPLTQSARVRHFVVQSPQCNVLDCTSMHSSPQIAAALSWHAHEPPTQLAPATHVLPQVAQFFASVFGLEQTPLQHVSFAPHFRLHAPQLSWSLSSVAQLPPHEVSLQPLAVATHLFEVLQSKPLGQP
jgi:hypothetical protein